MTRCPWPTKELDMKYHDEEWGVPVYDDRTLFEFLILEGAQAGLSWSTILNKRENYRQAFDQFDPLKIANYGKKEVEHLMQNAGIVRNRLKIQSTITNAQAYLKLLENNTTLSEFLWSFVDGNPIHNNWTEMNQIPAKTDLSDKISKALLKHGFKFVGSTICYAFMQATGMVNDHLVNCPRHQEVQKLQRA